MAEPGDGRARTRALHRARRRNRLAGVEWVDALYNAYLTAIGSLAAIWYASAAVGGDEVSAATFRRVVDHGPAAVGLVISLAVAAGIRSGARGGPVSLEPAVVQWELTSPVPRRAVLLGPAVRVARFSVFAGALLGGIVAAVADPRLPLQPVGLVASGAAAGALGGALAVGAALVAAGRRWSTAWATLVATVVLAWSVADLALGTVTSPAGLLGRLALAEPCFTPLTPVGAVVALAVAGAGLAALGGLSVEAARRRSGLVQQLRFAVTLQDFRTVVLLRRRLAQDRPRRRPWLRGPAPSTRWPVARRDLRALLRAPAGRIGRMLVLGALGGAALAGAIRGITALVVPGGLALFVAGYDAVEPLAQEVDHPSRWVDAPLEPGGLLVRHLPVALAAMVPSTVVAAVVLALLDGRPTPLGAAAGLAASGALGAVAGAAASSALAPPDTSNLLMFPEVFGILNLLRTVLPAAVAVVAVAPALALGDVTVRDARIDGGPLVMAAAAAATAAVLVVAAQRPRRI